VDNVPVFREFDWRWDDVDTAAEKRGLINRAKINPHESLMRMASRWKLTWAMRIGASLDSQALEVKKSDSLLSPPPKFGEL